MVRGGAIGDFILTLPAIGALRERWPEAQIEILGYPHIIELARGRHYADAVRSIEAGPMAGFFVPHGPLNEELAKHFRSFDLVVSYLFDPDRVFADNVRRCGARQLVEASPRPSALHAAEHYAKPLESLAIYVEHPVPRLFPNETDRSVAANFLSGGERVVAAHPGSGSERKNWPAEKFAALCRWLVDECAVRLLIVQGEADEQPVSALASLIAPRPFQRVTGLKLPELAAVLEGCGLFLGNDSGITHMAAAVGTPTVALFGPASLPIWEPRGHLTRVLRFGPCDVEQARQSICELWRSREVVDSQGHLA